MARKWDEACGGSKQDGSRQRATAHDGGSNLHQRRRTFRTAQRAYLLLWSAGCSCRTSRTIHRLLFPASNQAMSSPIPLLPLVHTRVLPLATESSTDKLLCQTLIYRIVIELDFCRQGADLALPGFGEAQQRPDGLEALGLHGLLHCVLVDNTSLAAVCRTAHVRYSALPCLHSCERVNKLRTRLVAARCHIASTPRL